MGVCLYTVSLAFSFFCLVFILIHLFSSLFSKETEKKSWTGKGKEVGRTWEEMKEGKP